MIKNGFLFLRCEQAAFEKGRLCSYLYIAVFRNCMILRKSSSEIFVKSAWQACRTTSSGDLPDLFPITVVAIVEI